MLSAGSDVVVLNTPDSGEASVVVNESTVDETSVVAGTSMVVVGSSDVLKEVIVVDELTIASSSSYDDAVVVIEGVVSSWRMAWLDVGATSPALSNCVVVMMTIVVVV